MERKTVNFAIVGTRGIARHHIAGIGMTNEARLTAVCDIHEDIVRNTAETYGIDAYYTDLDEMLLRDDIDVVIIATPDSAHREGTVKALRAGKHVLCEKPMALLLEDCKEMIQAAKETGKLLMIGQVCRYAPGFVTAKKLLDAGEIGDLFFVESEYAHDYTGNFGQDGWRIDPVNLRHPIIGGGCHAIDLLRWLAGNPTEVSAYANKKVLTDWPVDDCTVATMKFPNDVIGKVMTSIGCKREYTMRTCLYGTKGTIITDNTSNTISLFKDEIDGNRKYLETIPCRCIEWKIPVKVASHNMAAEVKDMCEAVLTGQKPKTDGVEGASTVAVCDAVVRSAASGMPQKVDYSFEEI